MSSTGIKVEFSALLARPMSPCHWPELLWVHGSHGQHARGYSGTPVFPATSGTLSAQAPGLMTFGTHRMDRSDLLFDHVFQASHSAGRVAHRGLASTHTQPGLPQFKTWGVSARCFSLSLVSHFAWHCWFRSRRTVVFPGLIGWADLADFPVCRVPDQCDTSRSGLRTKPAHLGIYRRSHKSMPSALARIACSVT